MEEKKPRGNLLGWIGVCLGALALFLVVFGPGLKEDYEEWKVEQAVKAELRQELEQKEKEQKERTKEKEERVDWTYEDYADAMRQAVIDRVNGGPVNDAGYAIDTEEELFSLRFDRIYVTGDYFHREKNSNHDLIIWYTWQDKDETLAYAMYYDLDDDLKYRYRDIDHYDIGTVKDFVDYWIENQHHLKSGGDRGDLRGGSSSEVENRIESRTEGCITLFTAEDFEVFYSGETVEDT